MINICNIYENFNRYKNIIIEFLTDYYGQEYNDLITKRINSTYIDFSSNPVEDYKYAIKHDNELNISIKLIIKLRYKLYKELEKKSRNNNFNLLTKYISKILLKVDSEKIKSNEELLWTLFSDENFNKGLIDSFSSKSTNLLNNNSIPNHIKENIINDRKKCNEISKKLGINMSTLTQDSVDEFIKYRNGLQENHKIYISINSQYGKKIFKDIKREFNLELPPEMLSFICFMEASYAGIIINHKGDNTSFYNYIKIPLIRLINKGIKGLDVNIIHELIHKIETNKGNVGIKSLRNEDNKIINEIRTQKLAIHITRKLHEQGIFIYDNPNDYKIEGESYYEWLFPLAEGFLEEFEDIFSSCAIHNDIEKLNDYFGPSWSIYSAHINEVYNNNFYLSTQYGMLPNIQLDENICSMINNMEEAFKKRKIKKRINV